MITKKPKDFYLNDETIPRAAASIDYAPTSYGALGVPFSNAEPEPLVSVDSPSMSISEIEELIIWLFHAHDWMENQIEMTESDTVLN